MPSLYLIPTPLGLADTPCLLSHEQKQITHITDFVVEAEKTARAHLKHIGIRTPIRELKLQTLNEHTPPSDIRKLLQPLREGRDLGLISEAGCPAVADPGADLVTLAHQEGFEVRPLVGPSSILLALMASGMNGQSFAFKGYIPADNQHRIRCLKNLEHHSQQANETQIFIETPYRNDALLADAIQHLNLNTQLCIACDLTLPTQTIISQPIYLWQKQSVIPSLRKRPTLFLLHANQSNKTNHKNHKNK